MLRCYALEALRITLLSFLERSILAAAIPRKGVCLHSSVSVHFHMRLSGWSELRRGGGGGGFLHYPGLHHICFLDNDNKPHFMGLSHAGSLPRKAADPVYLSFFDALLMLILVNLNLVPLCTRVIDPLKVYGISVVERSCLQLLWNIRTSSCCVNFYRHSKVSPLHRVMKSVTFLSSFCIVLINSKKTTRLWVLQNCQRNSCCPLRWILQEGLRTKWKLPPQVIVQRVVVTDHLWRAQTRRYNEPSACLGSR